MVDGEGLAVRQQDARFEQTALFALQEQALRVFLFRGQVVGGAGDDRPAAEDGIAVGRGGHVVLRRPPQTGAEDIVHAQALGQQGQGWAALPGDGARVEDLVEADHVAADGLQHGDQLVQIRFAVQGSPAANVVGDDAHEGDCTTGESVHHRHPADLGAAADRLARRQLR